MRSRRSAATTADRTRRAVRTSSHDQVARCRRRLRAGETAGNTPRFLRLRRRALGSPARPGPPRRKQFKQLVAPGTVNVKYSAGGLVDIEYAAQYLQVMHDHPQRFSGHPMPCRRSPGWYEGGIVMRQDGDRLRKAYIFIRILVDGLRMVREKPKILCFPPPIRKSLSSLPAASATRKTTGRRERGI